MSARKCHGQSGAPAASGARDAPRTVVLAGNPNVGKSVFFNALTGTYVDVSNFPGTTVEVIRGRHGSDEILDIPGVYGVGSFNDEESVARDVILSADVVVDIVDAVHPERDLFLTLQLIDLGLPIIVALNMADEARRRGVAIDREQLEEQLGVPVVETVAVDGTGIDELVSRLGEARVGRADESLESRLVETMAFTGSRAEALLVLEGDEQVAARHGVQPGDLRDEIYTRRRERVNALVADVLTVSDEGVAFTTRLSRIMLHPLTGIPLLIGLLATVYQVLGVWVAGNVVGITEETIMLGYWEPFVRDVVGRFFDVGTVANTVLAGEFGLLTMTFTYLLGVILPLVAGFYLLLSVLEDTGYLPRIAALADRALTGIGLNGRAVIPLILGLGCVTMGTLTTRILGSRRERFITTALMAIAVPCSAQIAVIAALMARVGPGYAAAYFGVLLAIFVGIGTLLNKVTPGVSTELLIDLPPLRLPRLSNVLRKSGVKVWHFMREVSLFFLAGAAIITTLDVTGALKTIQTAAMPLTVGWLRLPAEAATAFVMGFVRRDFGAAGFFDMALSAPQLLVAMVTITLFVPCIASVMVIMKERGWAYLAGLFVASVGVAFLFGGLLARVLAVIA
ncbi:MAG: ferrous iron transport protein B [Coriobacteriia bacterium]